MRNEVQTVDISRVLEFLSDLKNSRIFSDVEMVEKFGEFEEGEWK